MASAGHVSLMHSKILDVINQRCGKCEFPAHHIFLGKSPREEIDLLYFLPCQEKHLFSCLNSLIPLVDPSSLTQLQPGKARAAFSRGASLPSQVLPGVPRFNRVHCALHEGISPSVIDQSLRLIILCGLCVSSHVVLASLPAVRLGYVIDKH